MFLTYSTPNSSLLFSWKFRSRMGCISTKPSERDAEKQIKAYFNDNEKLLRRLRSFTKNGLIYFYRQYLPSRDFCNPFIHDESLLQKMKPTLTSEKLFFTMLLLFQSSLSCFILQEHCVNLGFKHSQFHLKHTVSDLVVFVKTTRRNKETKTSDVVVIFNPNSENKSETKIF